MTGWFKGYLLIILGVSVLGLVCDCLLPEGDIRKYASFGIAVILSVCIISPILKIGDIQIPQLCQNEQISVNYQAAIEGTVKQLQGFENARVTVENNGELTVSVDISDGKLLEKIKGESAKEFLKKILCSVYGIKEENIFIKE